MPQRDGSPLGDVEALVFDVFGTVVDWHGTVVRELEALGRAHAVEADWPRFANRWRQGYIEGILHVIAGQTPWKLVDEIHRERLGPLLEEAGLATKLGPIETEDLNRVWHRLDPWPDSVAGLRRLESRWVIATLSNGNVSLLVDMAKRARLPWNCILSAEMIGRYKPDPEVYRWAARVLGREPHQIALVAAHPPDLEAARGVGLRTLYVSRPLEYGPGREAAFPVSGNEFDLHAVDLVDLAAKLEPHAG
ncbi:MAG: haloacid dehalogenase type II [Deltaproteobacteria bacterium]|nr:haloacid dehalogenase type II [Deltaproteobacteria bacterium]